MRRTFGLTALLLLAVTVLALAGCTGGASSGAGVIEPYPTGSHSPTVSPSPWPTPSVSPSPKPTPNLVSVLTGRPRPTRMAVNMDTGSIFMVEGLGLGVGQGHLVRFAMDTEDNKSKLDPTSPQTFQINEVPARTGTPEAVTTLTSPVWIAGFNHPRTGKYTLAVTDNFNSFPGRVLLIEPELQAGHYTSRAQAQDLGALITPRPNHPLACSFDGTYLWWTEYNSGGRVRRADLTQNPPKVIDYMVNLNFPAGIASNGSYVAIAENDSARVLVGKVKPQPEVYPVPPLEPGAYSLTARPGDPLMRRPFEVAWTAGSTLVTLDGFSMPGGPGPSVAGLGNLRFFTGPGDQNFSNKTLNLIKGGLTEPVGLEVYYDGVADPKVQKAYVTFIESMASAGTVRKIKFQTVAPFDRVIDKTIPELAGFQRGFHALPTTKYSSPESLPDTIQMFLTQGFDIGQNNGSVVRYTGPSN